jgi:hypothetical protein
MGVRNPPPEHRDGESEAAKPPGRWGFETLLRSNESEFRRVEAAKPPGRWGFETLLRSIEMGRARRPSAARKRGAKASSGAMRASFEQPRRLLLDAK